MPKLVNFGALALLLSLINLPGVATAKWKTVAQDETPIKLSGWPGAINWVFRDGGSNANYAVDRWSVFGRTGYREIKNKTVINVQFLNPGFYWGGGIDGDIRELGWFNKDSGWYSNFKDPKWETGQRFDCYNDRECNFRNLKFEAENEKCQWIFNNPDLDTTDGSSGSSATPWAFIIIHCGDTKPFEKKHFVREVKSVKIIYPGSTKSVSVKPAPPKKLQEARPYTNMDDVIACRVALNSAKTGWVNNNMLYRRHVATVKHRGLTVADCKQLIRVDIKPEPVNKSTTLPKKNSDSSRADIEKKLTAVKRLFDKGLITKQEAAEKRQEILKGM